MLISRYTSKYAFKFIFLVLNFLNVNIFAMKPRHFLTMANSPKNQYITDNFLLVEPNEVIPNISNSQTTNNQTFYLINNESNHDSFYLIAGLSIIYIGTYLIWFIERKIYFLAKRLKNAINATKELVVIGPNHNMNGELVIAKGLLRSFYPTIDKNLGISVYNSIILVRHVEILQNSIHGPQTPDNVVETSPDEALLISSENNYLLDNHGRLKWVPYNQKTSNIDFITTEIFINENTQLGNFVLNPSELEQINIMDVYDLQNGSQSNIKSNLKHLAESMHFPYKPYFTFTNKYIYIQKDNKSSNIDDFRIWFEYIPCDRITVICSLNDNKFVPYDYETKKFRSYDATNKKLISGDPEYVENFDNWLNIFSCINSLKYFQTEFDQENTKQINWMYYGKMLEKEEIFMKKLGETKSQTMLKWIIRIISFQILTIGIFLVVLQFKESFLMGSFVELNNNFCLMVLAYILSIVYSGIIIALAWFFYNPLLIGIFLFASSLTILSFFMIKQQICYFFNIDIYWYMITYFLFFIYVFLCGFFE